MVGHPAVAGHLLIEGGLARVARCNGRARCISANRVTLGVRMRGGATRDRIRGARLLDPEARIAFEHLQREVRPLARAPELHAMRHAIAQRPTVGALAPRDRPWDADELDPHVVAYVRLTRADSQQFGTGQLATVRIAGPTRSIAELLREQTRQWILNRMRADR